MKFVKHFYYPYYYIETFKGSIISVFFLDHTFHFEDEEDLFIDKFTIKTLLKSKKVIEETVNISFQNRRTLETTINREGFVENFFLEFLKNK